MKNLLKIIAVVGLITLCSCSSEELEPTVPKPPVPVPGLESTAKFTPSYCNIWDINSLDGSVMQLESDAPVKAYDTKGFFDFEQRSQAGGTSVLVAKLKSGAKLGDGLMDDVIISSKADEKQFQVVTLIIRNESGPLSDDINSKERFAEYFSRAYQLWGDVGYTPAKPVLRKSLLLADTLINIETAGGTQYFQTTGSTLEETTKAHSYNFGIGGSYRTVNPGDEFMIGGSITGEIKKQQKNRNEYEYIWGTKEFRAASASLHTDKMKLKSVDFLYYIDNTLNEVLNNTSSNLYQSYGNDTTGIYNLLDAYGSYIATGGTLGASFNYIFYRKRVVSDYSIEWQLTAAVDIKKKEQETAKIDSAYLHALAKMNGCGPLLTALNQMGIRPTIGTEGAGEDDPKGKKEYNINGNFGTTQSYANYFESTESNQVMKTFGGNSNELPAGSYDKFNATKDPANWMIINYNFQSNGIQQQASFIPLYELCKENKRKEALKKALTPVMNEKLGIEICPYYATRHCNVSNSTKTSRIVVADFQPYYQDFGTRKYEHVTGQPKPIVLQGPDGKYRTYYPLMANPLIYPGNGMLAGYAFDPTCYHYAGSTKVYTNMLYYYALDYSDQCAGILDIGCFRPGEEPIGWIQRGHDTAKDTQFTKTRYIYVRLASPDTDENKKITGVCVYASGQEGKEKGPWNDGVSEEEKLEYYPIASTGGTEFAMPWERKQLEYFKKYYGGQNYENNKDFYNKRRLYHPVAHVPEYMWLGTTTNTIEKRCTYEYKHGKTGKLEVLAPEICHPLPWGQK